MTKTLPLLPKDAAVAPTYPGDDPPVVEVDPRIDAAHDLLRWVWCDGRGGRRGVTTRFYAALFLVESRYAGYGSVSECARDAGVSHQALARQVQALRRRIAR